MRHFSLFKDALPSTGKPSSLFIPLRESSYCSCILDCNLHPLRNPSQPHMQPTTLQEIERLLDKVGQDLWNNGGYDFVLDGVFERLLRLQIQATVQQVLERTAKILRDNPGDKPLPNQLATRVKHVIKFVFEKTTRDVEKQTQLRQLDFNGLKFCGLCYKIKEIIEMPATRFNFVVENVTSYVKVHGLSQYLYREDINKVVFGEFDPEDDEIFQEFLKCLFHFPP